MKSYAHEHCRCTKGRATTNRGDFDKKWSLKSQLHFSSTVVWFTITLASLCHCNTHRVRATVVAATFRPAWRSSSRVKGQICQHAQSVSYFRKQGCGVVDTWTAMLPKSNQSLCQFASRRFSSGTLQDSFRCLPSKAIILARCLCKEREQRA